MQWRGIGRTARGPWVWSTALPVVALVIWLLTPTINATALRTGGRAGAQLPPPAHSLPATTAPVTVPSAPTTSTTTPTSTTGPPRTGGAAPPVVSPSVSPATTRPTVLSTVPLNPGRPAPVTPAPVPSSVAPAPLSTASSPTTSTTLASSAPAAKTERCKPDPAAQIAALPPGGVFVGAGHCYDTDGILITKPVTINGGIYHDHVDTFAGDGSVHPIIRVKNTHDVTIENVQLIGANGQGGFHSQLVGQAGLDILSGNNVSIVNASVKDTFGDGLTVFANFGENNQPSKNLRVDGLTITNAGRQAITMAYATDSILNDVTINSATFAGWDFESDLPGIGSSNITVTNSHNAKGIRFIEDLHGPVTFVNCLCQRHVSVLYEAATSGEPVTFQGGTVLLPNNGSGAGAAGVTVNGPGRVYFDGVLLGRLPSSTPPTAPAWSVTQHAYLSLHNSVVIAPLGLQDKTSTVAIS